jgi:Bacterial protein of unknown function (DUF922)
VKFITVICFACSSAFLVAQQTPVIEYAAITNFHWGLFKGRINPNHLTEMGDNTGAVTVSSLNYTALQVSSHEARVTITARFHPEESWTRYPELTRAAEALEHEKRHFDITEIYARRMRQMVSNKRFASGRFKDDIDRMFTDMAAQHRAEQVRYDHETRHSIEDDQQMKWNKRIDAQLQELSAYAGTTVMIRLN